MASKSIYEEPPAALARPSLSHLAGYIGPGAIIASVTIGSGELVYASRSGAIFGYTLLWCFLYAGLFKAIQVYTAGRHITLTGEHPIVTWARLPGPRSWFPLLIAAPAVAMMPISFSAIPEILGGFIHRLVGMPPSGPAIAAWGYQEFWINVFSTLLLVFCVTMALGSSYMILERVSIAVLGVIVLCVGISVIVFGPNLAELLAGMFLPQKPVYPQWLLETPKYFNEFHNRSPWLEVSLYLSAVGGGAYDYIGYVGMFREKKWGLAGRSVATREQLAAAVAGETDSARTTITRAKQWQRAPFFDTTASFATVILVTLLFAVLATLLLHDKMAVPANNDLLNEQETFLSEIHPELSWLYRLGVFLAFIGTLYGAFEVYCHTFVESAAAIVPKLVTPKRVPAIRAWVIAYCFFGGLTMIWLPVSVSGTIITRITFGTIISGAASCGLWCFAMLWADHVRLPAPLRMSYKLKALTALAGAAMTALGIIITVEYFTT